MIIWLNFIIIKMRFVEKMSFRRGFLWRILIDKWFLEIVYFKIIFSINYEIFGCYFMVFY